MQKTEKVVKDESYHESAVYYNEEVQKAIEKIAENIAHPVPRKWALSVARQHKYHAGRHRRALTKLREEGAGAVVETEDGGEVVVLDDERTVHRSAESGQFVSEETADAHPATTVQETVEVPPAAAEGVDASPDPTLAAEPVDAGVDTTRELTAQEQADLAQAQADAAASKNGESNV